jgi:superfamily II DNA/RNA helicase
MIDFVLYYKKERGILMSNISFNDLNLHPKVLQSIDAMGFEEPSQIQAESNSNKLCRRVMM